MYVPGWTGDGWSNINKAIRFSLYNASKKNCIGCFPKILKSSFFTLLIILFPVFEECWRFTQNLLYSYFIKMKIYPCLIIDLVTERRTIVTWKYFLNLGIDLVIIVMVLLCLSVFCIKVRVADPGHTVGRDPVFFRKTHIWILQFLYWDKQNGSSILL